MNLQALFEILIVVSSYLVICYITIFKEKYQNIFLPATIIFFFLIRSRDFFYGYYNPDELQWIISANSLLTNTYEYCNYFFFSEFSRFLTILPLAIIGLFSDYIGYSEARLLNIFLFSLFFCLQYLILNKTFRKKNNTRIVILILAFCVAFGFRGDLSCFNSEIVVLNLISIALYFYIRWEHRNFFRDLFICSSIICLIPFAKDQALPISLGFFLYLLFRNRGNSKQILYLIIIPVIISITFLGHIIYTNSFSRVMLLVKYANQYSKTGLSLNSNSFALKASEFLENNFMEICNGTLLFLSLVGVSFIIWRKKIQKRKISKTLNVYVIISIITIFITIYPGNGFYHYSLFFYVFYPFYIYFALISLKKYWLLLLTFILFFSLKSGVIHNKTFFPLTGFFQNNKIEVEHDEISRYISQHLTKNDHLMVWGWDLKYYLETKTQRSSFAIVPVFLDPRFDNKKEWINVYIQDISKYRPKIIIEGVGENRFYFSDKKIWSIESVSSKLMDEIKKSYFLAKSGVNYRIFKLKNKQNYKPHKVKRIKQYTIKHAYLEYD